MTCSDAGRCYVERGEAFCLCDDGLAADGLSCAPAEPAEDLLRVRRRPGLAERVVEVALAQEGMGKFGVGRALDAYPHELWRYLSPNEWWCTDFVAWVYRVAGVPFTGGYEGGWLVPGNEAAASWFADRGLWIANGSEAWSTFEPRPGDFLRFATLRGGHAAIVTHVEGDTLHTIEGNVDNHVRAGHYERFRSHAAIDGIGRVTLPNAPPVVRTSERADAAWPDTLSVAAVLEDDGPAEDLSVLWSLEDGPADVAFTEPTSLVTEVAFDEPGLYVLAITAADGEHESTARLTVDVWELPAEPDPELAATTPGEAQVSFECAAAPPGRSSGEPPPAAGAALALLVLARVRLRGGRPQRS